ncbi:MAG TPA: hypothetical protein VGK17_19855 [Propionicimonas sp.]|jgi:hypothetical protein
MNIAIKAAGAALQQFLMANVEHAGRVCRDPLVQRKVLELASEIHRAWARNSGAALA